MNTIDYGNTVRIEYSTPPSLPWGYIRNILLFNRGNSGNEWGRQIERVRGGNEWDNLANWFPLDCLIAILSACLSLRMLDTRHGVDMGTPFLAPSRELSIRTLYLYANRTRNALIIQFCNCCRRCQRFAFELHAEFISIINAVGGILSYYYTKGRKRERVEWRVTASKCAAKHESASWSWPTIGISIRFASARGHEKERRADQVSRWE